MADRYAPVQIALWRALSQTGQVLLGFERYGVMWCLCCSAVNKVYPICSGKHAGSLTVGAHNCGMCSLSVKAVEWIAFQRFSSHASMICYSHLLYTLLLLKKSAKMNSLFRQRLKRALLVFSKPVPRTALATADIPSVVPITKTHPVMETGTNTHLQAVPPNYHQNPIRCSGLDHNSRSKS